jgi:hypothetical protein
MRLPCLPPSNGWRAVPPLRPEEILSLFENNSPLVRDNPYALGVPLNTLRALRSDWRVFMPADPSGLPRIFSRSRASSNARRQSSSVTRARLSGTRSSASGPAPSRCPRDSQYFARSGARVLGEPPPRCSRSAATEGFVPKNTYPNEETCADRQALPSGSITKMRQRIGLRCD